MIRGVSTGYDNEQLQQALGGRFPRGTFVPMQGPMDTVEIGQSGRPKRSFSFIGAAVNFVKGAVVDTISGMFSMKGLLTMAGSAALIWATGGAALIPLAALGAGMGAFQVVKGSLNAASALSQGDGEAAENAFRGIGSGTFTAVASLLGARAAYRNGVVKTGTQVKGGKVELASDVVKGEGWFGGFKGTVKQMYRDLSGQSRAVTTNKSGAPVLDNNKNLLNMGWDSMKGKWDSLTGTFQKNGLQGVKDNVTRMVRGKDAAGKTKAKPGEQKLSKAEESLQQSRTALQEKRARVAEQVQKETAGKKSGSTTESAKESAAQARQTAAQRAVKEQQLKAAQERANTLNQKYTEVRGKLKVLESKRQALAENIRAAQVERQNLMARRSAGEKLSSQDSAKLSELNRFVAEKSGEFAKMSRESASLSRQLSGDKASGGQKIGINEDLRQARQTLSEREAALKRSERSPIEVEVDKRLVKDLEAVKAQEAAVTKMRLEMRRKDPTTVTFKREMAELNKTRLPLKKEVAELQANIDKLKYNLDADSQFVLQQMNQQLAQRQAQLSVLNENMASIVNNARASFNPSMMRSTRFWLNGQLQTGGMQIYLTRANQAGNTDDDM